ncbi:MAG: ABC transporter permease [Planctomycetales bacterium]|nr:ABC transporter permease [Planctomycetales bacterium]
MVAALDRKLLRDLYAARGLLIAVTMILGLGISAYVANLSLYFNLELSRRSYYAQCRMADFWIDIQKFPNAELERLQRTPGVSELRSRIVMPVTVDLENVEKPLSGTIISMPPDPMPVINSFVLRQGGYFTPFRREEVIISDGFARARNIRPGDRIYVLLNDRRQELLVVGTAISSEFVFARGPGTMIPDKAGYVVLYVKQAFAEEATNMEGAANQIVGLLTPDMQSRPQLVLDQLERQLEPFGEATSIQLKDNESHNQLTSDLKGLRTVNLIVPTVFLAVSALILDVLMVRMAQQQRTTVGMLKATGYSNGQLFVHFMKFGVLIGGFGGLLGAAFGFWLAGYMLNLFRQFYEFSRIINRPYPSIVLGCIGLGVVIALLGAFRGVQQVVKLRPADAMRPKPPEVGRRVLLERWSKFWESLGFRWQMVIRGIVRHRLRTFTGVFSSMMGAALILQTLQIDDSFRELISFTFDRMLVSDFDLSFKDELDYGGFIETRRLPGIDYAEPILTVGCTFYNGHRSKRGAVTGIQQGARLTVPRDTVGDPIEVPETGVILTRRLAEILAVSPGDPLVMVPLTGARQRLTVPVSRVVESFVGTAAYADFNYLNSLVGEEQALNSVQAKVSTESGTVREFYRALKQTPRLQGFSALREQKSQLIELLKPLKVVNRFLIAFAGLLFCGGIVTSSLISLAERKQEIATFRVLGYQPRQIGGIFLRESLIINTLGVLFGLPVGYGFAYFINRAVGTDLTRLPFYFENSTWGLTIVLGAIFTVLGYLPVYRAVRRLDWIGALNVNE